MCHGFSSAFQIDIYSISLFLYVFGNCIFLVYQSPSFSTKLVNLPRRWRKKKAGELPLQMQRPRFDP